MRKEGYTRAVNLYTSLCLPISIGIIFLSWIIKSIQILYEILIDTEYKSDNLPFSLCRRSDGWNGFSLFPLTVIYVDNM